MFIMVMELVNRKVNLRGSMGRLVYAGDLAVLVEDAGSTRGVEGGIWEAWAEDEYGED